jgi:hypothetical protein
VAESDSPLGRKGTRNSRSFLVCDFFSSNDVKFRHRKPLE